MGPVTAIMVPDASIAFAALTLVAFNAVGDHREFRRFSRRICPAKSHCQSRW
jgi:hypothetical protein